MTDPILLDPIPRGDTSTIDITGLLDANGAPADFQNGDVLVFTAKANLGQPTAAAILSKTSADGGISYMVGDDAATVNIVPADMAALRLPTDLAYLWDLQLTRGVTVHTLAHGTGIIEADVTNNPVVGVTIGAAGGGGPCTPWVTAAEVLAEPTAKRRDGSRLDPALVEEMIRVAGPILYRLSGRQFAGVCTDLVRPCARFYKTDGYGGPPWWWRWQQSWGTFSTRSPHRNAGAAALHEISLGAYPLRDILAVRIDGQLVDPTSYEIHDRRWLVRVPETESWPAWQNLYGDPMTDEGTFGVWFEWGAVPDQGGVRALKDYVIELAKGASGDPCNLPARLQNLQGGPGQSYSLLDPMTFIADGKTGVYLVDMWLHSVNPNKLARRSSVINPDIPRPVRRTRTTPGS